MQFILINSSNSHCNSLSCTIPKHCIRCKAYVLIVVSVLPKSIFLERKTMLQSKWNYQKNKVQSHTSDKLQILWNNLNTLSLAGENTCLHYLIALDVLELLKILFTTYSLQEINHSPTVSSLCFFIIIFSNTLRFF